MNLNAIKEDFFNLGDRFHNKFDYIIEYTFYCAIDPRMRSKYINIIYDLPKEGGEFVGIFLPLDKDLCEGGPPFGVNLAQTIKLFSSRFKLIESDSHPLEKTLKGFFCGGSKLDLDNQEIFEKKS